MSRGITTILLLPVRFYSMDSWLKKSHDDGNKRIADDVEASVKTNANRVFACCTHWVPVPCGFFFPSNNYHKCTTQSVYYFNRHGSRKFLED